MGEGCPSPGGLLFCGAVVNGEVDVGVVGGVYLGGVLAVVGVGVIVPVVAIVGLPCVLWVECAEPCVKTAAVGSLAIVLAQGDAQLSP